MEALGLEFLKKQKEKEAEVDMASMLRGTANLYKHYNYETVLIYRSYFVHFTPHRISS
jgi:hypothetical protein